MVLGGKHLRRMAVCALEGLAALEIGHVLYVDLAVVLGRYVHALVAGGQTRGMAFLLALQPLHSLLEIVLVGCVLHLPVFGEALQRYLVRRLLVPVP